MLKTNEVNAERTGRVGHQTASLFLMLMGLCAGSDPFWAIENITGSSGQLLGEGGGGPAPQ